MGPYDQATPGLDLSTFTDPPAPPQSNKGAHPFWGALLHALGAGIAGLDPGRQQMWEQQQSQINNSEEAEKQRQAQFMKEQYFNNNPSAYQQSEMADRAKQFGLAQTNATNEQKFRDAQLTESKRMNDSTLASQDEQRGIQLGALMKDGWAPTPTQVSLSPAMPSPPILKGNEIKIGDKYLTPPEETMLTPPKGSIIEDMFGSKPVRVKDIPDQVYSHYIAGEALKKKNADFQAIVDPLAQDIHDTVTNEIKNPAIAKSFHNQIDTAKNSDKRTGSVTQLDAVQKQIRDHIMKTDPVAASAAIEEDVKKAYATARASKLGSMSVTASSPENVARTVDFINQDPTANLPPLMKAYAGDKQMLQDLAKAFAEKGTNLEVLSNQAKESREFAVVAQKEMDPILKRIDEADKAGNLGPLASRYNAFIQGRVGAGDPQYARLAGDIDLMRKLVGKIHLGVRGAGSPQNAEAMKKKLDEGTMDAATLKAGLQSYKDFVDVYAQLGKSDQKANGLPLTKSDTQKAIEALGNIH